MPNWCENDLIITGEAQELEKVLAFIKSPKSDDKDERVFDFNQVIPYPDKFKELDAKAEEFGRELSAVDNSSPEQAAIQREQIREKYGVKMGGFFKDGYNSGGYEWCNENWGTKWNACRANFERQSETAAKITFDTAWSPPLPVIQKLGEMFPACYFLIEFYEGGMGFQGMMDVEQGVCSNTSYDDYNGERGG